MTLSRLAALALLLVGLATACGSSHRVAALPTTIVFQHQGESRTTFYGVHADGTALSRLFSVYGADYVYLSPDGTKALVVAPAAGGTGPYILDVRTGKKQPVKLQGLWRASYPPNQPWSPDGTRLLLALGRPDYSGDDFVVYNPRTHHSLPVTHRGSTGTLAWAADGKSIVYATDRGIAAERLRGGLRTIVSLRHHLNYPASLQVSADGKWISFQLGIIHGPSLYVVHPNGRGLQRFDAGSSSMGAWSPVGERYSYQDAAGLHVVDPRTGRIKLVARARGAVAPGSDGPAPAWSPDGRWLLYSQNDLGFGAPTYDHDRIWVVRVNGHDAHAVAPGSPEVANVQVFGTAWVASGLGGKLVRHPTPVGPRGRLVLTTKLPVVALAALGEQVAVATGFGRREGPEIRQVLAPRGPIIRVDANGRTVAQELPKGCRTVSSIVLSATQLGYVCDTGQYENSAYALWLQGKRVVRTSGGQGVGTFLSGPVTDGRTVVYSVEDRPLGAPPYYKPRPPSTRLYETRGSAVKLVRTFGGGGVQLESIDRGRIVLLRYGRVQTVTILAPNGSMRKFLFRVHYLTGAALDGSRLVVWDDEKLTVVDLATGHRQVWPMAPGSSSYPGPDVRVRGGFAAYVAGGAVHVMRLSDGHEVVVGTPGATDPVHVQFGARGLFYAYNEAYSKSPGRVGFISLAALGRAITATGRPAH